MQKHVSLVDLVKSFPTQSSFRTDSYSNEYLLAKIGVDTVENEPLEVWGKIIQYYSFVSLVPTHVVARLFTRNSAAGAKEAVSCTAEDAARSATICRRNAKLSARVASWVRVPLSIARV